MGEFITINSSNIFLLKQFIKSAESSLDSFRYYNTRSYSVIKNHIYTCLLIENKKPIAYGHLDKENETIWLGIAVVAVEIRKGYGRKMMQHLIDVGGEKGISEINLSVDASNTIAIDLYRKFGFKHLKTEGPISYYRLHL